MVLHFMEKCFVYMYLFSDVFFFGSGRGRFWKTFSKVQKTDGMDTSVSRWIIWVSFLCLVVHSTSGRFFFTDYFFCFIWLFATYINIAILHLISRGKKIMRVEYRLNLFNYQTETDIGYRAHTTLKTHTHPLSKRKGVLSLCDKSFTFHFFNWINDYLNFQLCVVFIEIKRRICFQFLKSAKNFINCNII